MKWINSKTDGYLTIYLALSLTVILSLSITLIEGARKNGARFMAEYAFDVGMNSILAEYHKELLKQYDVFFIDTSYGTNLPSIYKTSEHLREYMDKNLSWDDLGIGVYGQNMYSMSVQNILIGNLAVATDDNGKVFRKQAIEYMSDKYGLSLINEVEEWERVIEEYGLDNGDVTSRRQAVDGEISALDGSKIQVSEEEWVTVEVDNPADQVNTQRNKGVLLIAMKDTDNLSNVGFSIEQAASSRELYKGQGPIVYRADEETLPELLLFDEYIFEKCGFYGNEMDKSHMKYQIEYILAGKDNDLDNLKSIVSRLLLIRETANVSYLFSDSAKRAQAAALAATVSAVAMLPQLQALLEYSILFAWAFAESVYDVRSLFEGGKVPLLKNSDTWHTDIDSLFESVEGSDAGKSDVGLSYEDYLRVLIKMTNADTKTMRLIDMAELDIRKTVGNENFRMDACVDGMTIEANLVSKYGYVFLMERDCFYE